MTTMVYFNNNDKTPVLGFKVDGTDLQLSKVLRKIQNWVLMQDETKTEDVMDMLVEIANQDGGQRLASVSNRAPCIMLVNSPGMGGTLLMCLEATNNGWVTAQFDDDKYFFTGYRLAKLEASDENQATKATKADSD